MTVQFLKDYTMPSGTRHRAGAIALVSDSIAGDLIRAGVAKERIPPGPVEKKAAAAVDPPKPEPEEDKGDSDG